MNKFILSIILVILITAPVMAQDFPFKPLPTVKVKLYCRATDFVCQAQYSVKPKEKFIERLPVRRRTTDGIFITSTIVSGLLTVGDVENSLYVERQCRYCQEVNPLAVALVGRRPNRAAYYALNVPFWLLSSYMSWRWKREDEALVDAGLSRHKIPWHIWNDLNSGCHAIGIWATLGSTGK